MPKTTTVCGCLLLAWLPTVAVGYSPSVVPPHVSVHRGQDASIGHSFPQKHHQRPAVVHGRMQRLGYSATAALEQDVINPVIASIAPSKTIEVHGLTKEMEARGEKVVSLCVGEPDFPPPPAVLEATIRAVKDGCTKYTAVTGTLALRQAIANDLSRRKGSVFQPSEIVVSNGAKQSVYQAILAVVRPGDEVIIPAPYWPSYPELVKMTGGAPIIVDTDVADGYLLSPQQLHNAITKNTRMLIFCNPSNPTGAVHSPERCEELAEVLRHDGADGIWVLADEIYERLTYGVEHTTFINIPGMRERTMIVNGFSKSHAMTGYRLGYLAAHSSAVIKAVTTIQGQITSCASAISQEAGLAALSVSDDEMQRSFDIMREKRDIVMGKLRKIPNIGLSTPQGAFYVLPDISHYYGKRTPDGTVIDGATGFCLYFLSKHRVALVTGDGFGYPAGVRFSYATSMENLEYALTEFAECLSSLQ